MEIITYPKVTDIIAPTSIPEELGFITNSLETFLQGVHYDQLFASVTHNNASGFYSLTLLLNNSVGFESPELTE